jgi:hypothetical protein
MKITLKGIKKFSQITQITLYDNTYVSTLPLEKDHLNIVLKTAWVMELFMLHFILQWRGEKMGKHISLKKYTRSICIMQPISYSVLQNHAKQLCTSENQATSK